MTVALFMNTSVMLVSVHVLLFIGLLYLSLKLETLCLPLLFFLL